MEKGTKRIYVTLEKTIRVRKCFEATPEELLKIEDGENPYFDQMASHDIAYSDDVEYDYCIEDAENDKIIIPWND